MPKIGKKKFPYNKVGRKAAKRYAKKTGKKMMMDSDAAMRMKRQAMQGM